MKATPGMRMTLQGVYALLGKYGIPKKTITMIREALTYDAVTEGKNVKSDRIFSAMALAIHNAYGFGYKRIYKVLIEFDRIAGCLTADGEEERDWTDVMEELKAKTGIVVETREDGATRLIKEVSRD